MAKVPTLLSQYFAVQVSTQTPPHGRVFQYTAEIDKIVGMANKKHLWWIAKANVWTFT